jgi:hypothetical protein
MAWTDHVRRFFEKITPSGEIAGSVHTAGFSPASENKYGVDIWDCTEFAQSRIAGSFDQAVAESFARLRSSNGDEHRDQTPINAVATECSLQYLVAGTFQDGPLFKAGAMEDKWDAYFFRPYIYFARSWRGELTYRAAVQFDNERMTITRIESDRAADPEFSRRVVDYLVKSHIFGSAAVHPLGSDLPPDPVKVATYSFAMFGRRCTLGTFADSTLLNVSNDREP